MTFFAVSTTGAVLAIIGLVIGLVVLGVVIGLLQGTLTPLRQVLGHVQGAKTAPMLERGIPGTDQLGQTRRLAESVPPLAMAYLQKLGPRPAASAPPPPAYSPATPAYTPEPAATPEAPPARTEPEPPAWKKYLV